MKDVIKISSIIHDGKTILADKPIPEIIITQDEIQKRTNEYWKKVFAEKKDSAVTEAKRVYSLLELFNAIISRGDIFINQHESEFKNEFVVDDQNQNVIKQLIYYFRKNKKFEDYCDEGGNKFSLKKSIMLRSAECGTGKTILMKLFSMSNLWKDDVNFNSYPLHKVINCRKIVSQYRQSGDDGIGMYYMRSEKEMLNTWVFDELGREDRQALYMGNRTNVMEKIMADRYDMFIDFGIKTHITTNIVNREDIETMYGDYIASRMKEMYNVIDLEGNSRRK